MGKEIVWTKRDDGVMVPTPVYTEPLSRESVNLLVFASLSAKYNQRKDEYGNLLEGEEAFSESTKLEVAYSRIADQAATGDLDAIRFLTERVLGKPMQQTQNLNIEMTAHEWVNKLPKVENVVPGLPLLDRKFLNHPGIEIEEVEEGEVIDIGFEYAGDI